MLVVPLKCEPFLHLNRSHDERSIGQGFLVSTDRQWISSMIKPIIQIGVASGANRASTLHDRAAMVVAYLSFGNMVCLRIWLR